MKSLKGIVYAILSSGTFGLIPLFSIPLMQEMDTFSILFYRFLFSTLMIGGICLIQKKNFKINPKQIKTLILLGLFYGATALGLIYSYKYIPSGIATTIHFLYPILVTLIMVLFFKERKSIALGIAAILSLLGVALLCWSGGSINNYTGIFLALGTVVTYATYIVGVNQSGVDKIDALVLTFYILVVGAIMFFIVAACSENGIERIPDASSFSNLLLLAFLATVISDLCLILAIKYVGSTTTSILGSMEPIVAIAVGILFFSEHLDLNGFFGLIIVLVSVVLVILAQRPRKESQKIES